MVPWRSRHRLEQTENSPPVARKRFGGRTQGGRRYYTEDRFWKQSFALSRGSWESRANRDGRTGTPEFLLDGTSQSPRQADRGKHSGARLALWSSARGRDSRTASRTRRNRLWSTPAGGARLRPIGPPSRSPFWLLE